MTPKDILAKVAYKEIFSSSKAHPSAGMFLGVLFLIPGVALLTICNLHLIGGVNLEVANYLRSSLPSWLPPLVQKFHAYLQWGSLYGVATALTAIFGSACGIFSPVKDTGPLKSALVDGTITGREELARTMTRANELLEILNQRDSIEEQLQISVAEVAELKKIQEALVARKNQYKEHYFRQLCERRLLLRALFIIPLVALACLAGSWIYPQEPLGDWEGVPFLVSFGLDRDLMHGSVAAALIILIAAIAAALIPRSAKFNKVTAGQILFAVVFSVFAANLCYFLISLGYDRYYFDVGSAGSGEVRGIDKLVQVGLFRLVILPAVAALGAQTVWNGLKHSPAGDPESEDS